MKITSRQLKAFLVLADTGNFSRTAEHIGLSQPTLSQIIRDLESELGASLFDRTTRRVELTEAGRTFRGGALRTLKEMERTFSDVRDLTELRRGRLRVAGPPFLAATILPRAVAAFARLHPGVRVEISDVTNDEMLIRLMDGRADLCIGTIPLGQADVRSIPLLSEDMMIFCLKDHPLTKINAPGWADAARFPTITLVRGSGLRELVDLGFSRAGVEFRPQWEVEQITTIFGMLAENLGIAILPRYTILGAHETHVLALPLTEPRIVRKISCVHPASRTLSAAGQTFIKQLRLVLRRAGVATEPERETPDKAADG